MSTHGKFNSGLWQCEACGAWLDSSEAVPGSWRWTGAAWEHGGHGDAPQAGHFPARHFASVTDAIAHATVSVTAERDAALATVRTLNADIAAAAGELRVPIPTPGSDAARLLRANIILRQERDEARAERRAARLDRDAAEEKLAVLRGGR